jgi:hypothetical protein
MLDETARRFLSFTCFATFGDRLGFEPDGTADFAFAAFDASSNAMGSSWGVIT